MTDPALVNATVALGNSIKENLLANIFGVIALSFFAAILIAFSIAAFTDRYIRKGMY